MQSLRTETDHAFLAAVTAAADAEVAALLQAPAAPSASKAVPHRTAMSELLGFIAVYTAPDSQYYGSSQLIPAMESRLERLEYLQGPTGLFDGVNLCSPPDSAFTINDACLALQLVSAALAEDPARRSHAGVLADVGRRIRAIVAAATPALVRGGVHTPNHRWELSAALAQIHRLDPDPDLDRTDLDRREIDPTDIDRRVDEWLAEGIDQLPDGMYSERSPLYATAVTNPSLLTIADASDRPWLRDHVRRNLEAFLPWFNPDGTVESVFSRRQDQWMDFDGSAFMLLYRRFAIEDQRPDFGAAASWLAGFPLHEPAKVLAKTRVTPLLGRAMPVDETDEVLRPASAQLESCGLYRFRHGKTTATVFGGGDHAASGVASGLSNNPTFLRFRHGASVLSDVRLSRSFFDLGPFRSMETSADGNTVAMSEQVGANFYLPLPPDRRRPDGSYALEHEGRFSSAMDFSHRPVVRHSLVTSVDVTAVDGQADVAISFEGSDTSFALELTFRPGGVLSGVEPLPEPGTYQLVAGTGTYTVGEDTIEFGPGAPTDPDSLPEYNPGENYKYLRGTNATEGLKVYITGGTRGTWRLRLKGQTATG